MIPDEVLGLAVERQVISAEQAERLRALASERAAADRAEPVDEERLRFVSGFGDVFVTIGLGLFIGSLGYFINVAAGLAAMWAGIAVAAWGLAEFFTRVRRMALPSIVLLVVFAVAAFFAFAHGLGATTNRGWLGSDWALGWLGLNRGRPFAIAGAALATVAAAALHYWRFRVPITIAAGAAAVAAALLGLSFALAPAFTAAFINPLLLACGVSIFAAAMRFDMSDPLRLTRRTDIAFWLHLLAAPLIVHPIVAGFLGARTTLDTPTAVLVLAVFLALGAVAVLVDRRAMLVSGLTYAGIAFGTLIRQAGFDDATLPSTLFALGAFVLLLSAGWRPLRAAILRVLPAGLARRLPNPSASSLG
ncbi:MAG TPA: hypothetical protein VF744_17425 [Beijerinckiaceae bacterium]|jgi:hypothetical protein